MHTVIGGKLKIAVNVMIGKEFAGPSRLPYKKMFK